MARARTCSFTCQPSRAAGSRIYAKVRMGLTTKAAAPRVRAPRTCALSSRTSAGHLAVRRSLRPPRRRVLPVLLPPIRRQIEDVVDKYQPVHPALRGAVRPVHLVVVAQEHAQHEPAPGPAGV